MQRLQQTHALHGNLAQNAKTNAVAVRSVLVAQEPRLCRAEVSPTTRRIRDNANAGPNEVPAEEVRRGVQGSMCFEGRDQKTGRRKQQTQHHFQFDLRREAVSGSAIVGLQ